ncbi:MAG: DUF4350 domain-containing protein [Candidatus Aminicenantales bacterium]
MEKTNISWLLLGAAMIWSEGTFGWRSAAGSAALIAVAVAWLWKSGALSAAGVSAARPAYALRVLSAAALLGLAVWMGGAYIYLSALVALALVLDRGAAPQVRRLMDAVLAAAWFIGLMTLVRAVVGARLHDLPAATPILAAVVRALGFNASFQGYIVHVQQSHQVLSVAVSWPLLGGWAILALVVGPIVLFFTGSIKPRLGQILKFAAALVAGALIRLVLIVVFLTEAPSRVTVLFHPLVQLATILPILLALRGWERRETARSFRAAALFRVGLFALAGIGLGMALFWMPAGSVKAGRLMIDETHSNWELSTEKMDTHWYGRYSTYSFWTLARWLDHFYEVRTLTSGRLDAAALAAGDVLMLKCPTRAYEPAEVAAVLDFVRGGGGVLMVGDHTDVFSMNTYLNQIAGPLGLHFNYDATYDFLTGALSNFQPPRGGRHPIVRGVDEFDFMTSCTLSLGRNARPVIVGPGLIVGQADYSTQNFFDRPSPFIKAGSLPGAFVQSAAGEYGRGRFFAWTDSTCWSNFSVLMDGNPALIQGVMAFLNHRAAPIDGRVAGLIVMTLAAVILAALRKKGGRPMRDVATTAFLAGVMATALLASVLHARIYRPPAPRTEMTRVAFDLAHGDFILRPASGMSVDINRSDRKLLDLSTFYVWSQRLDLFPNEALGWSELEQASMVVLPLPGRNLSEKDAKRLLAWVRGGGRLLVLADAQHESSRAHLLLNPAGLAAIPGIAYTGYGTPVLTIQGGEVLWKDDRGRVVAARARLGKGMIVACGVARTFGAAVIGGVFTEPDADRERVYEFEYTLLRACLELK